MLTNIYSWNVNGIRAVHRKGLWEQFLTNNQPDILGLQEIKAQADKLTEIPLLGYETVFNSAARPGYSGTAILSKLPMLKVNTTFPDDILNQISLKDSYGDLSTEGRMISCELDKFYVVNVYVPNAKGDLSRIPMRQNVWDLALLKYCQELEKHKPVIICGDFNVAHTEDDLANPKGNKNKRGRTIEEIAGFQAFLDNGFVDTFRIFHQGNSHYSWWSHYANSRARNVGWRIDYILVSSQLKDAVIDASIHASVMGSDHCPVSVTLDL